MQWQLSTFLLNCLIFLIIFKLSTAKILSECDAARELKRGGVSGTFISNWVCLMKSESGLDTNKVNGPGAGSSYSYGVFQINSSRWCKRGYKGGECNAKCESFANEDISDDIKCATKIQELEGFKYWLGWQKKCKNGKLPNVANCKRRRRRSLLKRYFFLDDHYEE